MEAVQACAKKTSFRSLKNCFSAKPQFSPRFWVNNVPGPHVYPHIDFCVDWSSMCEKKSEVKKLCFRKASVFFNLLGKTMFQVPKPTQILILRGLEAIQACAKKDNCSELEKLFHQQSPISSHKTIRGHAAQKKTQRGIANLTCKQ